MDIQIDLIYSRARYDVTNYFRSEVIAKKLRKYRVRRLHSYFGSIFIEVRKTAENAASYGFGSNFSGAAFCLSRQLEDFLLPYVTTCVRRRSSAFVVRRRLSQSDAVVYLENGLTKESSNFTTASIPTYCTSRPDTTSLTTFGRKLSRKSVEKAPLMTSGAISRERFKRGSGHFTRLAETIAPHKQTCRI